MIQSHSKRSVLALLLGLALVSFAAVARAGSWDRAENIRSAATAMGAIHKNKGRREVNVVIMRCYKNTVTKATAYTQEVERCLTQDVIYAQVNTAYFARLSEEARKKAGVPDPDVFKRTMALRVTGVLRHFGVPVANADKILEDIQEIGVAAFLKAQSRGQ